MKNWKTTIAGLTGGALNLYANGTNLKSIVLALALAALGAFSKDHDVTGGTSVQ